MTKNSLPSFITEDQDALVPGDNQIKSISSLVEQHLALEAAVESAAQNLKNLEDQLRKCGEVDLPEAMAEAGVKVMNLTDGTKVEVTTRYKINISKERRPAAIEWLAKNGQSGVIKAEVAVEFPKGDMKKAEAFAKRLMKMGVQPSVDQTVNTTTVEALINELIEQNSTLPDDKRIEIPEKVFGLFQLKKAKIKLKKR